MKYTEREINLALTGMFKECSFNKKVRKAYRKSFNYHLDSLYLWTGLYFRGTPIIDDTDISQTKGDTDK